MKNTMKKQYSNNNLLYRKYYDLYHFMISKKQSVDGLSVDSIKSIHSFPSIKQVSIKINSWEGVKSRKNAQHVLNVDSEFLLIMKTFLTTLFSKPTQFFKKNVYAHKLKSHETENGIESEIILHDSEDIYNLFDLFYLELELFKRFPFNEILISKPNKEKEQVISFTFNLDEFSEVKLFEDALQIELNPRYISVTFQITVVGDIEIVK